MVWPWSKLSSWLSTENKDTGYSNFRRNIFLITIIFSISITFRVPITSLVYYDTTVRSEYRIWRIPWILILWELTSVLCLAGHVLFFFFPSALIVSRALLYRRYSDERLYLRLLYFLNFSARICTHQTVICVFKQWKQLKFNASTATRHSQR